MVKFFSLLILLTLFPFTSALAHHPAEDIVDPEIYAMIDAMVADTPHADLVFDDEMGSRTTTISIDTVSAADDLIQDGLLDGASLLDGTTTITIDFPVEAEPLLKSLDSLTGGTASQKSKTWSDWGRPVRVIIQQQFE